MPSKTRTMTWYLRSPKDIDIADDIDQSFFLRGSADPVSLNLKARKAPTGQPLIVDVKADGVSVLDQRVLGTLPAGQTRHRTSAVGAIKAPAGSWVSLSLVQVGNQEPGIGVTVEMEFSEATPN